jgi:amidase
VRDTVCEAVRRLASAGLAVEETQPDLADGDRTFRILRSFQFAALWNEARHHSGKLKPEVIWNIEEGLKLSAAEISEAEANRARLRLTMLNFLDVHGVLITPPGPVEPFPVAHRYVEKIDGQKLATYLDWLILGYAVAVCGCPAISIPCGQSTNGLPVGLQLIGKPYHEAELLSATAWCEQALGHSLTRPISPNILQHTSDGICRGIADPFPLFTGGDRPATTGIEVSSSETSTTLLAADACGPFVLGYN